MSPGGYVDEMTNVNHCYCIKQSLCGIGLNKLSRRLLIIFRDKTKLLCHMLQGLNIFYNLLYILCALLFYDIYTYIFFRNYASSSYSNIYIKIKSSN